MVYELESTAQSDCDQLDTVFDVCDDWDLD